MSCLFMVLNISVIYTSANRPLVDHVLLYFEGKAVAWGLIPIWPLAFARICCFHVMFHLF